MKARYTEPKAFLVYFLARYTYEPETGHFRRKVAWRHYPIGSVVQPRSDGYVYFRIRGEAYLAHRVAHLIMTGEWPEDQVDHQFGDKSDNRWEVLRPADNSQNNHNRGLDRRNKSGFKGVVWCKRDERYLAYIRKDGITKNLGSFGNPVDAAAAYAKAAVELFGEFARVA